MKMSDLVQEVQHKRKREAQSLALRGRRAVIARQTVDVFGHSSFIHGLGIILSLPGVASVNKQLILHWNLCGI